MPRASCVNNVDAPSMPVANDETVNLFQQESSHAAMSREMSGSEHVVFDESVTQQPPWMTTLIEDGPNMCWASGHAGMSDGVMTFRKTSEICLSVERSWLREISGKHCEMTVCRDQCKSHKLRKRVGCDKFDRVSMSSRTDVKIFARWEGVRGPFVLVCGTLRVPLAPRRCDDKPSVKNHFRKEDILTLPICLCASTCERVSVYLNMSRM